MEDRYVINTSSGQWLENNIEDWDLVYDIVKKHNGYIDSYLSSKRFTFNTLEDVQAFLDSDEMLPIIMMIELMR